jgi:hypothetical protein
MKMSIDLNQLNQEQRNALARVLMNDTQPMPEAKPEKAEKPRTPTKGAVVMERIKNMKIGEYQDLNDFLKEMPNNPITTLAYLFRIAHEGYIKIKISKVDAIPDDFAEDMCYWARKKDKTKTAHKRFNTWKTMFDY